MNFIPSAKDTCYARDDFDFLRHTCIADDNFII